CRGFVTAPKILFLDEPTLGLDVQAARTVRRFIRGWMAERPERTMVLTTHYLAEAEELCDRIAIVHRGQVLACDTPARLKRRVQRYPVFELALAGPDIGAVEALDRLPGVKCCTQAEGPDASLDLRLALEGAGVVSAVVQRGVGGGSRRLAPK